MLLILDVWSLGPICGVLEGQWYPGHEGGGILVNHEAPVQVIFSLSKSKQPSCILTAICYHHCIVSWQLHVFTDKQIHWLFRQVSMLIPQSQWKYNVQQKREKIGKGVLCYDFHFTYGVTQSDNICDNIFLLYIFNVRFTQNCKLPMLSKPTSQLQSKTGAREDGSSVMVTHILWFPTGV